MAQNAQNPADSPEIGTILAEGVDFDGVASFSLPVLVNCAIKGSLQSESDVFISADARVNADISARRVSIKGTIDGSVTASDRVELFRTARVSGKVACPDMVMQSGALLNAQCRMEAKKEGAES